MWIIVQTSLCFFLGAPVSAASFTAATFTAADCRAVLRPTELGAETHLDVTSSESQVGKTYMQLLWTMCRSTPGTVLDMPSVWCRRICSAATARPSLLRSPTFQQDFIVTFSSTDEAALQLFGPRQGVGGDGCSVAKFRDVCMISASWCLDVCAR